MAVIFFQKVCKMIHIEGHCKFHWCSGTR